MFKRKLASESPGGGRRGLWAVVLTALATVAGVFAPSAPPAQALGVYVLQAQGLDSCAAPTTSEMQKFWTGGSSWWYWGIYIGGSARSCSQPNLTASWVTTVTSGGMAWRLLPIWVGPQDPCQKYGASISTNTTTAYAQGQSEAAAAYRAALGLGLPSNTVLVYDLEARYTQTATCAAAAKSFISGWVAYLHVSPRQTAGVYTSACLGNIAQYAGIANVPDFIWAGDWSNVKSTSTLSCVGNSLWVHSQRHKQYRGNYNLSWNGIAKYVDLDCANAPVDGSSLVNLSGSGCA
ncbi:MAG: DUF1906 domain-containing protein [Actinomycetia bacterium]|nr:DUF1906 domain-containing protein [Actinomycetes bacterium]